MYKVNFEPVSEMGKLHNFMGTGKLKVHVGLTFAEENIYILKQIPEVQMSKKKPSKQVCATLQYVQWVQSSRKKSHKLSPEGPSPQKPTFDLTCVNW